MTCIAHPQIINIRPAALRNARITVRPTVASAHRFIFFGAEQGKRKAHALRGTRGVSFGTKSVGVVRVSDETVRIGFAVVFVGTPTHVIDGGTVHRGHARVGVVATVAATRGAKVSGAEERNLSAVSH